MTKWRCGSDAAAAPIKTPTLEIIGKMEET